MVNIQSKEVLARLLATENLTVVHQNVQTASFNVKDRVLTLPLWDEMENYTYDHLVGHEVAHALYTPSDEWMEQAKAGGSGFQTFLNVVEDARIEKLIQRRYPGLRRQFIKSYKKLLADGFFGKNEEEINSFKLIDRLNILFKCGMTVGVQFGEDEKSWITEIENAETFEQVVDIATRLYDKAKEEHDEEQEQMSLALQQMLEEAEEGEDEDDSYGNEGDAEADNETGFGSEEEEGEQENGEGSGPRESQEQDGEVEDTSKGSAPDAASEDESEGSEASTTAGHDGSKGGPESVTDKALNDNIANQFNADPSKKVFNITIPTDKSKAAFDRIVDYKTIIEHYTSSYNSTVEAGAEMLDIFRRDNKKTINYLVKEFEMKKKAAEYKRATTSKTGVIDTLKMNNYKFSDDIFKKMTVLPEGKDHGLLMFVDWSGSMVGQIKNTIEQLLNLVMFCRQVNIPFEVYAFSDRYERGHFYARDIFNVGDITLDDDFHLLQFFNNKMSRMDFNTMCKALLATGDYFEHWSKRYHSIPHQLYLGGTPLNDAIVAGIPIHTAFKSKNRLDVVNTIFLTDGASNQSDFLTSYEHEGYTHVQKKSLNWRNRYDNSMNKAIVHITDPVTKKRYRWQNDEHATPQLLRIFRDHTQSNVIGFHILPNRKPSAIREIPTSSDYTEREQLWESLRKDKWCLIPNYGYTAYFGLLGGKALAASNGEITVADDASKAQIRSAFKKANGGRKGSRVMLSKFIDLVA